MRAHHALALLPACVQPPQAPEFAPFFRACSLHNAADSPASLPPVHAQHQQQGGGGGGAAANLRRLQKGGSRPTSAAAAGAPAGRPLPVAAQQQQQQQHRLQQLEAVQERRQRQVDARKKASRFIDAEAALSGDDASGECQPAAAAILASCPPAVCPTDLQIICGIVAGLECLGRAVFLLMPCRLTLPLPACLAF